MLFWRRKARELALQILFQADVAKLPIEEALEASLSDMQPNGKDISEYAAKLVIGVWEKKDELDSKINSVAIHWPIERMTPIDRNLLRLSLYEILFVADVPYRVSINEAVELAKEYGTKESHRFVNGVLGAIVRELGSDKSDQKP